MKAKEIRQHTDEEIRVMIRESSATLADLKFNNAITPVENPNKIRGLRRDISRMNTILRERELQATKKA